MIFVFGSNLSGYHGAGAAKIAYEQHGAVWGVGEGLTGNSYALPTKDLRLVEMPLRDIREHIQTFVEFAWTHDDLEFQVTRVACGLAGFKDKEIAPLFINSPKNCFFDDKWRPYFENPRKRDGNFSYNYWGTF